MAKEALRLADMEAFEAVAQSGSFSKAAERLGVSQPAISQAISRLESRLQRRLVERTTRKIGLTSDGQVLRTYARAMSRLTDAARRHFDGHERLTLRIGMVEDFALTGLHRALALLTEERDGLAITFFTGLSTRLRKMLETGELDLAVTKRLPGTLRGRLLGKRELVWSGDVGIQSDLDPVPIVTYPESSETRECITEALRLAGRSWIIVAESEGLTGIVASVRAELGVAAFTRGLLPPGLVERRQQDLPELGCLDYLVEAAPKPRDPLISTLVTVVEDIAGELLGVSGP